MKINWFIVASALFLIAAAAVTLFPGEQPRGYVNTPIGIAIVCSVLAVAHEEMLVRKELITIKALMLHENV